MRDPVLYSYETDSFVGQLDIDRRGESATFHRRQKIRSLEDNTGFLIDRFWGDGVLVDSYVVRQASFKDAIQTRKGFAAILGFPHALKKAETFEFETSRRLVGVFTEESSFWELTMFAPTKRISLGISAPRTMAFRDPYIATVNTEGIDVASSQRRLHLEVKHPRMYVPYRIEWSW